MSGALAGEGRWGVPPDLAQRLPRSLLPFCTAMTVGSDAAPASRLTEEGAFDTALMAFATRFSRPDRAALVSFWSLYYLAALIVPATVAVLLDDMVLPAGFDEVGLVVGPDGSVAFRLPGEGRAALPGRRFETLVDGHLDPFVAVCARRSSLSARLFWANASVTFAWVLGELRGCDIARGPMLEVEAMLTEGGRLANPFASMPNGNRIRRICCLRHRLDGVAACAGICPHTRKRESLPPVGTALARAPSMR